LRAGIVAALHVGAKEAGKLNRFAACREHGELAVSGLAGDFDRGAEQARFRHL
jgi:hypothetical protein